MENKTAKIPGLTWDLLKDRLIRHGIPAAGVGAGIAGLAHLMSMQKAKEEQQKKKDQSDTIVVELPVKKNATSPGQMFWDAPLAVGTTIAGGTIGYALVDHILKRRREIQLKQELDSLKNQYSNYLAQEISSKKATEFHMLDGLLIAATDAISKTPVEESRKQAAQNMIKKAAADPETAASPAREHAARRAAVDSMFFSLPGVAALLSGILAHKYLYNRDKEAAQNTIKKAAADPETVGSMFFSLPGVAALLSGILAHKYFYNRDQDIERALEKEEADKMKIAPKQIKIVSKPVEDTAVKPKKTKSEAEDLLELKSANLVQKIAPSVVAGEVVHPIVEEMVSEEDSEEPDDSNNRHERRSQKIVSEKDLQEIDQNTLMLLTDMGNVQIDALDPEALQALQRHKDIILRNFALGMNTR